MTSRREEQAGEIIWVRSLSTHIMVINLEREREDRRVTSRRGEQAGDIM